MAIYLSPYPAARPINTNYNYVAGDFYIDGTGTPYIATTPTTRVIWASYSGTIKPAGQGGGKATIPALVPNSLATPITVAVNQVLSNQVSVSAYGGTAVVATGGASVAVPGITPIFNVTWSPALPSWITPTYVKSVPALSVLGATAYYNQVEVQLNGTAPATAITQQTYTATFTDGAGTTAQATFTLTPAAAPPPASPPVASSVSQTVAYNSTNNTINLSVTNSPTSVAVATPASNGTATANGTTITYTPTPGYSGSDTFTYTATNSGGTSSPATVTITVTAPLILAVTSAVVGTKTFTVGTAIASFNPVTISSAGVTPYAYSIVSPTLPSGLAISATTGIISGTPIAPASLANYVVQVADSSSPTPRTSSTQFAMVVNPNTPIAVVSGSIPVLTQSIAFTPFTPVTIQSGTGTAPFSYAISPSTPLPSGLVYSSTGTISGTATSFTNVLTPYTVNVTDSVSQTTSTQFNLRVNSLPTLTAVVNPTFATNVINTGTAFSATPVSASPSALGFGTLSYAIVPTLSIAGLNFSTTTGLISGTPTQVSANTSYSVTISDQANQKSTGTFSLQVVAPPPSSITIVKNLNSLALVVGATTNLPSNPIGATGGTPPYAYEILSPLPSGLTFVTTSGFITGVATTSTPNGQAVVYSVKVTDQYPQSNTGTFNLTVTFPTAINITTTPNVALVQNTPVSTTYPSGLIPVNAGSSGYQTLTYSISPSITSLGLNFNTGTGVITGTPSVYYTTSTAYTVTVRDNASQVSTGTFNLVITPPAFTVTTNPLYANQRFTQTIPISVFQPVSATGGAQPYVSYEISNTNLGGLTFSTSTGQITGTPSQVLSTTSYAVTVTDSIGTRGTSSFSISVAAPNALAAITSATYSVNTLTVGSSVGLPFNPTLLLSNGYGSLTYSINPPLTGFGLTFTTSTGIVSGTPTAPSNTTTYTVSVYDSLPIPQTTTTQFSLYVKYADLVTTLTTSSITLVNTVYTSTQNLITFTGGAQQGVTYSISPQLPSYPALQFISPGIIQGTPSTTSTTSSYSLTITDNITGLSSSKNINIGIVAPTPITFTATSTTVVLTVNSATTGISPVRGFGGYGGLTYTIAGATNGTLGINASTGVLTGIPSVLAAPSQYSVTIKDKANQVVTGTFNLSVISTPIVIQQNLSSVALIVGAATNLPSRPIGATGGTPPYSYAIAPPLISGLSFVSTSGFITGIATTGTGGPVPYSITVSDAYQSNTGTFNLNVTYPIPITLTTVSNVTLIQGTPVSITYSGGLIPVSGGNSGYLSLSYAINTALPTGLSFNTSTGAVTGTPSVYYTTSTPYSVTVRDQASQTSTGTFNLVINPPAFSVKTSSTYSLVSLINTIPLTAAFRPVYAQGGVQPYSYQINDTNLGGLSFSTSTGLISGTTNQIVAAANYSVTVRDSLGSVGTSTFDFEVTEPATLSISTVPQYAINTLTVGSGTNFTPTVIGSAGYGSLTFDIDPTVPAGLTFVQGVISGTPTAPYSINTFTVTVTDSLPVPQTSSTQFKIAVAYPTFATSLTTSSVTLIQSTPANVKVINFSGGAGGGVSYSTIPELPGYPSLQLVSPGVISGNPTTTSTTATYALVITDSVTGQTSTQYISLSVVVPNLISLETTTTTVTLYANSATTGIVPVFGSGGTGSLSYSITSTSLPNGTLGINASTGALTGTPSVISPSSSYSVTVTDSISTRATGTFSLAVLAPPITLTVNTPSKVLTEYAAINPAFQPVVATNLGYGGLNYAISPVNPANPTIASLGLSFNPGTGFLSGTPIAFIANTPYAVTVSDQNGQISTATFNLTVNASSPPLLTTSVPQSSYALVISENVSFTPVSGVGGFLTSGSNYSYVISPSLSISGLSFSSSTGVISGAPTSLAGTATYIVSVQDSVPQTATGQFQLSVAATPPTTGPKGYAGSLGFAGSTGYVGSTGFAGSLGYAGSLGFSGSIGYAGSIGYTGSASTAAGYVGSTGYTGSEGKIGYTGSRGCRGYTGSQGDLGYTGSRGYDGSQGEIGYSGSRGDLGYTGSEGKIGYAGSVGYAGSRGVAGYDGSIGALGYTGSRGYDGSQGLMGFYGSRGCAGYYGSRGDLGYSGSLGYTGSRGYDGSQGITGYDGSKGELGYTGSLGYSGSTGYYGSRGDSGYTGSQGDLGYSGSLGYTGSRGYDGSQGDVGYTGSIGDLGYTGSQGCIGYYGSTGYVGSVGDTGYTGSRGDLGYTGSQGYAGSSGYTGSKGDVGYAGSKGDIGYAGSKGDTGYYGSTGFVGSSGYAGSKGDAGTSVTIIGSANTATIAAFDVIDPYPGLGDGILVNGNLWVYSGYGPISGFENVGNIQGPKGDLGYTGSLGYQGSTGYYGSTGYAGSQGEAGYTGSIGEIGYAGSQGVIGSTGYTGSTGDIGYTGSKGDTGYSGSTGFVGSQGISGYAGSIGDLGYTGSIGDLGYTGSQGDAGYWGSTGYAGSQGTSGYTGSVGDLGYTGSSGYYGSTGYTGSKGELGYVGSSGALGYTGSQGLTGYNGSNGYDGSIGQVGYTGSFGTTGYTGSVGEQGYWGSTGYVGSQGIIGYAGSQGIGQAGYDGSVGEQGYWGSTGYAGSQGEAGYTGSIGEIGYSGSVGEQGYWGSTGYVGSQGTRGYSGSVGAIGFSGSIGAIGYSGSQGNFGYSGSRGFVGSRGCSGFTGSGGTGFTGSQGSGYTGSRGTVGYTGSGGTGFTGSKGIDGYSGSTGSAGYVGSRGSGLQISGYVGSSGSLPAPYCGSVGAIYATGNDGHLWIWTGVFWADLGAIGYTGSMYGGGGTGGSPNLDGGEPGTNYGGIASICGGGVSV